ncbi:MAG: T9SS type A sorting domain-containing protein [Bacteroidales bacterium]|nr:T9SS type A sorting domain-containing protein [Bacteroidales bacterium]
MKKFTFLFVLFVIMITNAFAQLNVIVNANNDTICAGRNATLTAVATGGQAPYQYSWSNAATNSSTQVIPTTTTTYFVTVTDNNSVTATGSIVITVNPKPTITANNATICGMGQVATLCASGGTNYTWSNGATTTCRTASPPNTNTYYVTGTNENGCSNTARAIVTVSSPPQLNVNNASICIGNSANICASGQSISYTWSTTETETCISVAPTVTTSYYVTGTRTSGCTNTARSVVTVNDIPVITIKNNKDSVCGGTVVNLNATGANNYTWSTMQTGSSINVSPTTSTVYSVVGSVGGCTASSSISITVYPIPIVTATGGSICGGSGFVNVCADGALDYTWNNGQSVSCFTVSPSVSTTYTVTGTSADGCTKTARAVVGVGTTPTITAANGTNCSGVAITICASGGNSYTWSTGNTGNCVSVNPTVTTTYFVTGANTSGCTNLDTAIVTVKPLPDVGATGGIICRGSSIFICVTGGNTYTWSTGPTQSCISVAPTATINYTVSGTGANGCIATAVSNVIVNQRPVITATGGAICSGSGSVTVCASGGTDYSWNNGETTDCFSASPTVNTTYTVTGTDENTCTNTAKAAVVISTTPTITATGGGTCEGVSIGICASGGNTYTWSNDSIGSCITVNPTATTTYTVTGANASGCVNTADAVVTTLSLPSISSTGGMICLGSSIYICVTGGTAYTWSTTQTQSCISVAPTATTNYTVTGSGTNGCINTAESNVIVNQPPTITATGGAMCSGTASVVIFASGGIDYTWDTGETTSSITVSPTASVTYAVTGVDANSCSNTAEAVVVIGQTPTITANNGSICKGSSISICGGGGDTYTWSEGTSGMCAIVAPTITTTYTVTGTNADGCTNTANAVVTVKQLPNVIASNDTAICIGYSADICASGGVSYTWSTISTMTCISVNPTVTTTYYVTGTGTNGCKKADDVVIIVNSCVGITENNNKIGLNVFPNPTEENINIIFNIEKPMGISVKLVNLSGQVVYSEKLEYYKGTYSKAISLLDKTGGVYYLQIITDNTTLTRKIILVR